MGLTRAPAGGRGGGAVAAPEPGGEGIARRLESSGETRGSGRSPEGGLPLQWKSLSGETSVADLQVALQENVFCWLLDGPAGPLRGGAGAAWDWAQARPLVAAAAVPVVVAGGIRPDNIRRALAASGAAGVDLASGVETSPGVKSRELMISLFEEVARVRR